MIFEQIAAGGDRNFAYLVGDKESSQAAIIDPGYEPLRSLEAARTRGLSVRYVISTHSHADHVVGNEEVIRATGAEEVMHAWSPRSSAVRVADEQTLALGELKLIFFHTPGHIPDHVCVLAGDHLMTGDLLFVGKVGGTGPHFKGSDPLQEWNSLRRLMTFPHAISVWPGHDYGTRSHSTIGDEIANNPFLRCRSFEEFTDLKANWAEYKKLHKII